MAKKLIAPLRIDFAGGWIDVPEFHRNIRGYVVNAAISPHITHDRDCIDFRPYRPGGGVSSSTAAVSLDLLKQITHYSCDGRVYCKPSEFAETVYHLENHMLNFKIGRQDQYAIAIGGINCMRFGNKGLNANDFDIETHITCRSPEVVDFEERLLLVHSGIKRKAQNLVEVVKENFHSGCSRYVGALRDIADCGTNAALAVQRMKFEDLAEIMSQNWDAQKRFAKQASSSEMDETYRAILKNGALGGKICGAGGGGYFVFYCSDREKAKAEARRRGLQTIAIRLEMTNILNLNNLEIGEKDGN